MAVVKDVTWVSVELALKVTLQQNPIITECTTTTITLLQVILAEIIKVTGVAITIREIVVVETGIDPETRTILDKTIISPITIVIQTTHNDPISISLMLARESAIKADNPTQLGNDGSARPLSKDWEMVGAHCYQSLVFLPLSTLAMLRLIL